LGAMRDTKARLVAEAAALGIERGVEAHVDQMAVAEREGRSDPLAHAQLVAQTDPDLPGDADRHRVSAHADLPGQVQPADHSDPGAELNRATVTGRGIQEPTVAAQRQVEL